MPRKPGSKNLSAQEREQRKNLKETARKLRDEGNSSGTETSNTSNMAEDNNTTPPASESTAKFVEQPEAPVAQPVITNTPIQDNNIGTGGKVNTDIPADMWSDEVPKFTPPINNPVKDKSYSDIKVGTGGGDNKGGGGSDKKEGSAGGEKKTEEPFKEPAVNPVEAATQKLTPEEIRTNAEQGVDMVLKGYEKLHAIGRWYGKIGEEKLVELENSGEIDLEELLMGGTKGQMTARQFFQEFNAKIDESIVVDDKFKNDIRPALIRIAIKRGWLINDEVYAAGMVLDDLGTKVGLLMGLKGMCTMVLNHCMEEKRARIEAEKKGGYRNPPQQQEPRREAPRQEAPPPKKETTQAPGTGGSYEVKDAEIISETKTNTPKGGTDTQENNDGKFHEDNWTEDIPGK